MIKDCPGPKTVEITLDPEVSVAKKQRLNHIMAKGNNLAAYTQVNLIYVKSFADRCTEFSRIQIHVFPR